LTTLYLASAKNTNSWCARQGNLQHIFPLHVSMVPSSVITVTADGECLTCSGFSLDKIVRLGNFEFISDYFGGLSLSPKRGDAGATFMGSNRSEKSTPRRTMIKDSVEEFLTASSGEGSFTPPPLLEGTAWGLCLLPSQPHHG
jgi:hypothetical protein